MNAAVPRAKLAAVLGMLGSDHDGERAAAALIASKLVREAGVSWVELLGSPDTSTTAERPAPAPSTERRPDPHWREMLAVARRHRERLTDWERHFVASIGEQRTLSRKQWAILAKIADKAAAMTG